MANRKGKVCRFTPYIKEEQREDQEKEKIKLDIEILRSLRYKFKEDTELKVHFDMIINKLVRYIKK